METLITATGRELILLRDSETLTLPRDPKIREGLTMFRKRRSTGLVDVIDAETDTRWVFELVAGEVTQQCAIMGIDVPADIRALPHPLAIFRRDAVLTLDELQH